MNLVGQRFGMLIVEQLKIAKPYKNKTYLCKCDCGNYCHRLESTLVRSKRDNRISSCGCYSKKNLTSGDSERCKKAGLHRKDSFVDGCNIQMTLRKGTISTNTSGYQGISWSKTAKKWHVYIGYKNKRYTLGFFDDLDTAIKIRKQAELEIKNKTFNGDVYVKSK